MKLTLHVWRQKDAGSEGRFVRYELGSPPKWVKPGEEGNKIGYHRSFQGKLRFEQNGREDALEVRVTITWQGRWFITHLLPFKK